MIGHVSHLRHVATAMVLLWAGCSGQQMDGPTRFELAGKATFNGTPIPAGEIRFDPDTSQGNQGPGGFAPIVDGRYETRSDFGVIGGPHIVRITGYDGLPDGELLPQGKPLFSEHEVKTSLPEQGGTMDFDVKAENH